MKLEFAERESASRLARYFGPAMELRKNNPRIIPEAHPIAAQAFDNLAVPVDPVIDDHSPSYQPGGDYRLDDLSTRGYATLLRMERGRIERREVFGPMRFHYGFFKIRASRVDLSAARAVYVEIDEKLRLGPRALSTSVKLAFCSPARECGGSCRRRRKACSPSFSLLLLSHPL